MAEGLERWGWSWESEGVSSGSEATSLNNAMRRVINSEILLWSYKYLLPSIPCDLSCIQREEAFIFQLLS